MISTSEFRKGLKVELDGKAYVMVEHQFVSPGKGSAFHRTKLKDMQTGQVLERTFKSGEKVEEPDVEEKTVQFMYIDAEGFHFLDQQSYETVTLREEQVGDHRLFMQEGIQVDVVYYKGRAISLELPNFVELKVVETEPGIKGDTASGGGKPAKLETGATVSVPFHISEGDVLKIDTRTNTYVEKVK
jgi:elongation factor P